MRVVNEPVKDRIRQGGIWNTPVPLGNGDLGGNEGGGVAKAVIEDFQNILRILDGNGIAHLIIEDQQTTFGQGTQCASERTITAHLGKCVKQTGSAVVTHGETAADGCGTKCGG